VRKLHREYHVLQSIGAPRDEGYMDSGPAIVGGRTEQQNERYLNLRGCSAMFNAAEQQVEDAETEVGRKRARSDLDDSVSSFKK
jgi:hypothetical protein